MGRTSAFDRQQAIQTVIHEIWQQGYESCSVKALSEKLGITRSSFYHAFESREALLQEALEVYFQESPDQQFSQLLIQLPEQSNTLFGICQIFKSICALRANDPDKKGCMAINCLVELHQQTAAEQYISTAIIGSVTRFESLLQIAVDNNEISAIDIPNTALALQNILIGINVTCRAFPDEQKLWGSTKLSLQGLGVYQVEFDL